MYLVELEDEIYNSGICVKLLAISGGPYGGVFTTFELTYPLFIHAQLMTHRVFARNSASMRAIPTRRVVDAVNMNPAIPSNFKQNQSGMVGGDLLDKETCTKLWLQGRDAAVKNVQDCQLLNMHKETINRQLSPYFMNKVVLSGTEFENFFNLRIAEDAQDEIMILATLMKKAYQSQTPSRLPRTGNDWHLPYTTEAEKAELTNAELCMLSVARCAVVSYDKHEGGTLDLKKAAELWMKLIPPGKAPHLSAFEHTGRRVSNKEVLLTSKMKNELSFFNGDTSLNPLANYLSDRLEFRGVHRGWCSLRWLLEVENFNGPLANSYYDLAKAISNGKAKQRSS